MSDTALNQYIQYGTAANRALYTPDPPQISGSDVKTLYLWRDSDGTEGLYAWDGAAWDLLTTGGGGITALTTDVTASGSGSVVATIANDAVTYAKMQNVSAASKLLGRGSAAGAGNVEEITLGTNLTMSGTTLDAASGSAITESIGITVDGGGSVLTTGVKGFYRIPYAGTITRWTLSADAVGDIEFDVLKDAFGSVPTTSIVASAPPTMTADQFDTNTTLTGWTTSVSAGDCFGYEITGVPDVMTRVTLQLDVLRS